MTNPVETVIMAYEFIHGATQQAIAEKRDISRELVRQLLLSIGITGQDGGKALSVLLNERYQKHDPMMRFMPAYGCCPAFESNEEAK